MKLIVIATIGLVLIGCHQISSENSLRSDTMVGIYKGRDVIDTEERLTLSLDHTFTFDFIPLGQTGESYGGRWRLDKNTVTLIGKLESGEEEKFPLDIAYEKGVLTLAYTWESHRKQRATMLIPNVFVRAKGPDYSGPNDRS